MGDSEGVLDSDSFEAAVMAGDRAANEWLQAGARIDSEPSDHGVVDGEGLSFQEGHAPWLTVLAADDRGLVREYMLANRYPEAAAQSIDEWPLTELRHLLDAARQWKARDAHRAAERAELDHQLQRLEIQRAESRAVLDRLYRHEAQALVARDLDKSIMMLTGREARRSRTGNHLQGNPGLDLERHIRDVAAERGFAISQPHWDRASKRLFIDLYHPEAEAWWDSGEALGAVLVPPDGKILDSKRPYRGLYPFQRAAINAAYRRRHIQPEVLTTGAEAESMDRLRGGLAEGEHVRGNHVEERRELTTQPHPDTTPHATAVAETVVSLETSAPSATDDESTLSDQPATTDTRRTTVPNARKGFKLTLWVSPTDETGLADAHGFLQLDGADPVPFCQLKAVRSPLARALQEAYVAIEKVRARPPRMAPPTAPQVRSTTAAQPRQVHAAPQAGQPAAHAVQTTATKTKAAPAQPSLF